jgi:hypothetical protein
VTHIQNPPTANAKRAEWARQALTVYLNARGGGDAGRDDSDPNEEDFSDLIGDLLHLASQVAVPPPYVEEAYDEEDDLSGHVLVMAEELVGTAMSNFEAEVACDECGTVLAKEDDEFANFDCIDYCCRECGMADSIESDGDDEDE